MGLEKTCEFYDHSRCLLKNHYCDLDCDRGSMEVLEESTFLYENRFPGKKREGRDGENGLDLLSLPRP